jgi:Fur family ferric uptake transcriptional regulator
MCNQCDYSEILTRADLEATAHRVRVLEIVGESPYPLSASNIYNTLSRSQSIDRATVYRILDLLVSHHIVERISTGSRAAYYGLAPNENHRAHPHFYCRICGQMDCLSPDSMHLEKNSFIKTFPGRIEKVEIRVDGICKNCLNHQP